jgi:hypothetical protein
MTNSKLVLILNRLKGEQIHSFQKFLLSPFFNEKKDLIRLFDKITTFLPVTADQYPDKEKFKLLVWKGIYPRQPFEDVKFRRLLSDLTQLLFQFLAYEQYQSSEMRAELDLLKALNKPALEKHFNGIRRKIDKRQEASSLRNSSFFFHSFELTNVLHQHQEKKGSKHIDLTVLDEAEHFLDCFYICQKLKYYCDHLGYRNFLSLDSQENPAFEIVDRISGTEYLEEPAILLFYLAAQMLRHPEEESYFRKLKEALYTLYDRLDFAEQRTLFTHLINYCIHIKINRGKTEFYRELFSIYTHALEREILMEDALLPSNHYKNLITLGLHLREFNWVEQFIHQYSPLLPKGHRENAVKYNLAVMYFHKKEYDKTIELLRDVELRDISLSLGSKLYLLRSYYELGEFVALDFLLDSFRIYLQRNKLISKDVKQQYLNILRFTKKLSGLSSQHQIKLKKLHGDITNCKNVGIKKWLIDKVEEMLR